MCQTFYGVQFTVPSGRNPITHLFDAQLCPAFTGTNALGSLLSNFVAFFTVQVVSVSQLPDANILLSNSPKIPPFAA